MPLGRIQDVDLDGYGFVVENDVHMIELDGSAMFGNTPLARRRFHYVHAAAELLLGAALLPRVPAGIPGLPEGTKLQVERTFMTDDACPLGKGLVCLQLEGGTRAVFTNSERGVAWMNLPPCVAPEDPTQEYERSMQQAAAAVVPKKAGRAQRR